jgi:hypothetical protein
MRKHILEQKETLDRLLRRRDDAEKQVEGLISEFSLAHLRTPHSHPHDRKLRGAAAPMQKSRCG